jgi:hypothetical protein
MRVLDTTFVAAGATARDDDARLRDGLGGMGSAYKFKRLARLFTKASAPGLALTVAARRAEATGAPRR